jgi:hypothetical protein
MREGEEDRSNQKRRASSMIDREKEGLRKVQLSHISSPFSRKLAEPGRPGGKTEREREPHRDRPGTDRTACMVAYAPSIHHPLRQGRALDRG